MDDLIWNDYLPTLAIVWLLVSSSTSFSVLIAIIIVAVIALSKLRKTFRCWKVKRKPIFVITMLYLGLTCFFAVSSFFIGIPFLYLIVYLAVFTISQFVSYHYADRSLSFWKTPDGSIYSMDGLLIHVVYIVSVVLRFAISLAYIGSPSFQYQIEASGQVKWSCDFCNNSGQYFHDLWVRASHRSE